MNKKTRREEHDDDYDEIAGLGKLAVKGIVTVGTVGITANLMGGVLGSMPKLK